MNFLSHDFVQIWYSIARDLAFGHLTYHMWRKATQYCSNSFQVSYYYLRFSNASCFCWWLMTDIQISMAKPTREQKIIHLKIAENLNVTQKISWMTFFVVFQSPEGCQNRTWKGRFGPNRIPGMDTGKVAEELVKISVLPPLTTWIHILQCSGALCFHTLQLHRTNLVGRLILPSQYCEFRPIDHRVWPFEYGHGSKGAVSK